jgi:alkylhydroperoxidase/carboxymuconolactone decarboxylase family protein YurZ
MTLTSRQRELRDKFIAERGFWAPPFEAMLHADADFLAAYLEFSSVPVRHGALEPKIRELIYLAVDAATTHLHEPGTRAHIRAALGHGATRAELMEVLELTSVLGIHTATMAVPILLDELGQSDVSVTGMTPEQAELKRQFVARRGFWARPWDAILTVDPDFLAAYLEFSGVPWASGVLPPKIKELIYVAIDSSTTHLHTDGTRGHIRQALQHGATREEVMAVLELTSVLGIHTMTMAVPILFEEWARQQENGQ